jgi:quinol monooxygenase YgiN
MPIRALISMTFPSAEAAEAELAVRVERCREVEANEPGCVQYEIFRSAMKPEKLVLIELWESEALFDEHWQLNRSGKLPPQPHTPGRTMSAEFYLQKVFANADGVWTAAEPERRVAGIRWY